MAFEPKRGTEPQIEPHHGPRTSTNPFKSQSVTPPPSAFSLPPSSPPISGEQFDSLVDLITQAVRQRLITQGVKPEAPRFSTPAPNASHPDQNLAGMIDHTLLKPDATLEEIKKVCEEARQYHFATVCVNTGHVGAAARYLKGSGVKAIAVVGFPLGAAVTSSKVFEARDAIQSGAEEIDMVINIGALKGRDYAAVMDDIRQVVEASKPFGVKVILETSNLTLEEKIIGCALSKAAGAAFVKTSTGFGAGGATVEDVALMRRVVGPEMGVKASGGIRTTEDAKRMIQAGANRIGASASVSIVTAGVSSGPSSAPSPTSKSSKLPKKGLY